MTGHSMGGDIVMYFAKEYPDEVKWVVTLDNLRVPFVKHGKFKILSLRSNEGATARGDDAWRLTHRSGHQRCVGALRSVRPHLLERLAARRLKRLACRDETMADALGWATDAIDARAFVFLAARGLKGMPLSYPATMGVPIPMTVG